MLKLITSNKVIEGRKDWEMHPEIKVGMNKIKKWLEKKAQEKEETIVFSYNPIIFRIGLLLKLQGEKVSFVYIGGAKSEEVMVDDLGYYVNAPTHFLDMMEDIQRDIVDIRNERKGGIYGNRQNQDRA